MNFWWLKQIISPVQVIDQHSYLSFAYSSILMPNSVLANNSIKLHWLPKRQIFVPNIAFNFMYKGKLHAKERSFLLDFWYVNEATPNAVIF